MSEWLDDLRSNAQGSYDNWESLELLQELVAAYDSLMPPIEDWPENMNWFTVDANGRSAWHEEQPQAFCGATMATWLSKGEVRSDEAKTLPPGVDWRECIWSRYAYQSAEDV